jgi:hypothetical protein
MRKAIVIVVKNLAKHVNKPVPTAIANFIEVDKFSAKFGFRELEFVVVDCGGNPEILAMLFGVLAGNKYLAQKEFNIQFLVTLVCLL